MLERDLAPLLIGQDPTRINLLWQQMRRGFHWRGGIVETSAASGVEMALWDLTGKAFGLPVYKLLGGAVRDRVRLYARGDIGLADQVAELRAAIEEGYTAFKFPPSGRLSPYDEDLQVDAALALAAELRAAAGSRFELILDCAGLFAPQAAARLIDGLERLGPMLFVEEPVNADVPRGLAGLSAAFPGVRIAAGERVTTRWGFREWLETGCVHVVQPDVTHCGGIGELLRIAAGAETYNLEVAPHNPYGPVALAASLHACAVMPNFLILEHCRTRPHFAAVQKVGPRVEGGSLWLTDRPGLGVELDWDYVRAHPYGRLDSRTTPRADGSLPCI
jgi:galactonate dehydratase